MISTRNNVNLVDMPAPPRCKVVAKTYENGVYTAGNCRPLQNENAANLIHITFAQNQNMRGEIDPFIRSCVNSNTGKVYWSIHKKIRMNLT